MVQESLAYTEKWSTWFTFSVTDGRMLPTIMSAFANLGSDKAKYAAICELNSAQQIKIEVDPSTIIMSPASQRQQRRVNSRGGGPAAQQLN